MKKLFAIMLALVLCMSFGAMAQAEEAPFYRIITSADYPPFEFTNSDGTIDGFDIAVIRAIMTSAGLVEGENFSVSHIDFDFLLAELESGNADIVIAAMTIDPERAESVLFSDPYFDACQAITVAEGSEITCLADLTGKKIGVQQGTTGDLVASEIEGATIERYTKAIEAMMDLQRGVLDAVVTDIAPSRVLAGQLGGLVVIEDEAFEAEQYGIVMRLGSEEEMATINAGIAALKESGLFDELYATYFMTETEEEAAAE
ncbi:MAG: transporter substrate-binding domain-containing protein [Eubacteriales bacterium]|nr:transporter substrate-binding domain-containing protein [Eubacteriales bacterium]